MHHRRCPGMIVPGHRAVRAPRPAAPRTQHEKDREMTEHPTEQPTPATDLRGWRREQLADLLRFGEASLRADGAAQWLDDDGRPDLSQPVHTWITSRMAHVYAFASLLGAPGAGERADAALHGLRAVLVDAENGGWVSSRGPAR